MKVRTAKREATDQRLVETAVKSPGRPLDPVPRHFFERRFDHDFSRIRVHADRESDRAAKSIGARAFTLGPDIAFREGSYDPRSEPGKALLAHELAHSVEQESGGGPPTSEISRDESLESHTDSAAAAVMRGTTPKEPPCAHGPAVQMKQDAPLTERQKIEAALASKDNDDIQAVQDFSSATTDEKLELIRILAEQFWMSPYDEIALEQIWASFGSDLVETVAKKRRLWEMSIAGGAEIEPILAKARGEKIAIEATTKAGSGKSFGEVGSAVVRLADLTHDLSVLDTGTGTYEGNKCTTVTAGVTRSDCTEFVREILRKTFTQQGQAAVWAKVEQRWQANQKLRKGPKMSGLDIQAALQSEAGWKGIYWAPDPRYQIPKEELGGYNPVTGKGTQPTEASYALDIVKSKGTYYKDFGKKGYPGVKVGPTVTNYAPEKPNPGYGATSTTKPDMTQLEKLKKLPFGVLSAHAGFHMTIISYGRVIEVHQDAEATNVDVIQQTNLEAWALGPNSGYHYYASGVIVAPAADVDRVFA